MTTTNLPMSASIGLAKAESNHVDMDTILGVESVPQGSSTMPKPVISVVVPVYGCRACLEHLHERLTVTLNDLVPHHEIVLVDNRAEDGSWPEIEHLVDLDPAVRGIRLSRNFGQH